MALFVDLVALSNGLHGSVQMDLVALFSWIGWLRHHGIFNKKISKDKIGIACTIDEDGNYVVHTADRGRPTSSMLIDIFKNSICHGQS